MSLISVSMVGRFVRSGLACGAFTGHRMFDRTRSVSVRRVCLVGFWGSGAARSAVVITKRPALLALVRQARRRPAGGHLARAGVPGIAAPERIGSNIAHNQPKKHSSNLHNNF